MLNRGRWALWHATCTVKAATVIKTFARCGDGAQPKKQWDAGELSQGLRGFTALDTEEAL